MNLVTLINPQDRGGLPHSAVANTRSNTNSQAALSVNSTPSPSAPTRHLVPELAETSTSNGLAGPKLAAARPKGNTNGVTKPKAARPKRTAKQAVNGSGSGRNKPAASLKATKATTPKRNRTPRKSVSAHDADKATNNHQRHHQQQSRLGSRHDGMPPQQAQSLIISNARAAAARQSASDRSKRPVSIMDVVLDAQLPNRRLNIEDLRDAIDDRMAAFPGASGMDGLLSTLGISDGLYHHDDNGELDGSGEELLFQEYGRDSFLPNEIYNVSALRSTAAWDPSLGSESSEGTPTTTTGEFLAQEHR
ncbi:hypothetical protein BC835DRAFT_64041 [Cytidiella melzeri]|nr:hypothetical protein BC835DRAFT_64041 [Cytidiella melzeri]